MRNRAGITCMISGAMLVLAALSLFLWNRWDDGRAGRAVSEVLPKIVAHIEEWQTGPGYYDPVMEEVTVDEYDYIGYLAIPGLGLELPVMSEWDYLRLKIAPCRYTGSAVTNDLVIAAHNYESHFGRLSELSAGDEVLFIGADGALYFYEVVLVEILEPTAVEEMTSGDHDLTLFTCTYGGQSRVTVRCERKEGHL